MRAEHGAHLQATFDVHEGKSTALTPPRQPTRTAFRNWSPTPPAYGCRAVEYANAIAAAPDLTR